MSELILYSYYRSSCSYRVRIALNVKEIAYEYRAVHLVRDGGEQHKAEYLALNPMGQVPCLVHQGNAIAQSMAMIEYIDAAYPHPPLFPGDALNQARVRQLCEIVNTGIQPIQNLKVLKYIDTQFGAGGEGKAAWAKHWIEEGFVALEKALQPTAGGFCVGDVVTAADAFLVPQVYNARRFAVDMARFPTIARIDAACLALAAFQKAEPANQPDAPAED